MLLNGSLPSAAKGQGGVALGGSLEQESQSLKQAPRGPDQERPEGESWRVYRGGLQETSCPRQRRTPPGGEGSATPRARRWALGGLHVSAEEDAWRPREGTGQSFVHGCCAGPGPMSRCGQGEAFQEPCPTAWVAHTHAFRHLLTTSDRQAPPTSPFTDEKDDTQRDPLTCQGHTARKRVRI